MSTRGYKNVRIFTQLLTLILILVNTALLVIFFVHKKYFTVEEKINSSLINLEFVYKYTAMLNITLGFFASCCVNSKIKMYMKIYLLTGFFLLAMHLGFLLYTKLEYKNDFSQQFSLQMAQNPSVKYLVMTLLDCTEFGENNCMDKTKSLSSLMIHLYCFITVISFIDNLLLFIMIRVALSMDIAVPLPLPPKIESNVPAGFSTESLRARRVIKEMG
ncbi:hypothetical protein LUQ84_003149 [Hamiltosporidium tvaerminnensis]|nr:hypothetical protein LUQ84_003149 [Hamiltosporidium tvaerminnensis]